MATIKAYRVDIKPLKDNRTSCTVYASFSEPESLAGQEVAIFYGIDVDAEAVLARKDAQIQTALNLIENYETSNTEGTATLINRLKTVLGAKHG